MTDLELATAAVQRLIDKARREGEERAAAQFHELEFASLNELKEAERRGAEEMRERAAELAEARLLLGLNIRASDIRALPITPRNKND